MRGPLVLLICALAACGTAEAPAEAPAGGTLVVYDQGGGFAPMPRHLVVRRDGRATVTVRTAKGTSRHRFRLGPARRRELRDVLAAARRAGAPKGPHGGCADCFTYAIRGAGIDVDLDQASLEDASPALRRAVALLERLSR